MDSLALVFSSGWASGINAYLVVLVLGISERINDFEQIPNVLGRWDVLAAAAFMYSMEFIADKIPYIDSTWDAISTAIRPTVGAVIGVLLAGDASSLDQAVLAVVGGGTALLSHSVKAGSRLAINASPEPVTNITASRRRGPRGAGGHVVRRRPPASRGRHRRGPPRVRPDGAVLRSQDDPARLAALEAEADAGPGLRQPETVPWHRWS